MLFMCHCCVLQGARGNDGPAGAAGPPVSFLVNTICLCSSLFPMYVGLLLICYKHKSPFSPSDCYKYIMADKP